MRRGLAYERKVARRFKHWLDSQVLSGELIHGQWYSFTDANGHGYAQSDILLIQPEQVLLVECKLTQSRDAIPQLLGLYLPLVKHIWQRPVLCVQCCHNLVKPTRRMISHPRELLEKPRIGVFTWHFLGK